MADPVDLHPGPYAGTYKLIGGSLALDFANLVSYRGGDRQHDWLLPASNAHLWATAVGHGDNTLGATDDQLCDLRELLARIFLPIADRLDPAGDDLTQLNHLAATARADQGLAWHTPDAVARWDHLSPTLVDMVVLDATGLLTSRDALDRIEVCGECRWLFRDATKNRSRRWCDPADCGNRARQRRYAARHAP